MVPYGNIGQIEWEFTDRSTDSTNCTLFFVHLCFCINHVNCFVLSNELNVVSDFVRNIHCLSDGILNKTYYRRDEKFVSYLYSIAFVQYLLQFWYFIICNVVPVLLNRSHVSIMINGSCEWQENYCLLLSYRTCIWEER